MRAALGAARRTRNRRLRAVSTLFKNSRDLWYHVARANNANQIALHKPQPRDLVEVMQRRRAHVRAVYIYGFKHAHWRHRAAPAYLQRDV